jgi:hypothetical protein
MAPLRVRCAARAAPQIPLMNVMLPFVWKSFEFIFTCNVGLLAGLYWYKGVWKEVYGLPFEYAGAAAAPATPSSGGDEASEGGAGPKQGE